MTEITDKIKSDYSADNIQVLEGLEAVRKRPATNRKLVRTRRTTRAGAPSPFVPRPASLGPVRACGHSVNRP